MSVVWNTSTVATGQPIDAQARKRALAPVVTAASALFDFVLCFVNTKPFGVSCRAAGLMGALAYLMSCGQAAATGPLSAWNQATFARGINLSSGALNPERNPAIYGKDYIYPPPEDLDYYASKGFAVVRLPYRWERLQPSLFGKLDGAELGRIKSVVAAARARNMRVILSPHNGGRYFLDGKETLIGTAGVPIEAFADFSYKVAAAFAGDDAGLRASA